MAPSMPVAVAEARNISGGVNPIMKLPSAPQLFWLEGPLEPPVGGHFCLTTRSKELVSQHLLPRGRIPFIESLSFLERECCSTSSGQDRRRGLSVLDVEKEIKIIIDSRTYLSRTIQRTTAHYHTLSRLSTLQTNPHQEAPRGPQEAPRGPPPTV